MDKPKSALLDWLKIVLLAGIFILLLWDRLKQDTYRAELNGECGVLTSNADCATLNLTPEQRRAIENIGR